MSKIVDIFKNNQTYFPIIFETTFQIKNILIPVLIKVNIYILTLCGVAM